MTGTEWLAIAAVLTGLLLGLPVLRRVTIRFGASAEASRKTVHFTMGLAGASFPWIFDRPLPVCSDVATQTWLNSKGTSPHPKSIGSFRATVKGWLIAGFPGLVWLWRDSARIAPVLFAVILLTPAICLLSHGIQTRYRGGAAGLWMIKGTLALLASTPALLLR